MLTRLASIRRSHKNGSDTLLTVFASWIDENKAIRSDGPWYVKRVSCRQASESYVIHDRQDEIVKLESTCLADSEFQDPQ